MPNDQAFHSNDVHPLDILEVESLMRKVLGVRCNEVNQGECMQ